MNTHHRLLLIGPTGQVGWELLRCTATLGTVIAVGRGTAGQTMDLANPDSIRQVIREFNPSVILNAAAYTAVDKAEQEPLLAQTINGTAPGILAEEAKRLSAILIHYSTDYVFDGTAQQPYLESHLVKPLSSYGTSKLAGEQAIQAVGGQYFIFRTAWVYGTRGKNFLLTIQRLANEREELKIVADQFGAPTWSRSIAEATAQVLTQLLSPLHPVDITSLSGIYHLTCGGQTTWYEFAKAILAHGERHPRIVPITTAEYPTPAKRPGYSVLSNTKLHQTFGLTLPPWEQALELCLSGF